MQFLKNYRKIKSEHVVLAISLLLFIFIFSLKSLTISSFSMSPTFEQGDVILVDWISLYLVSPFRGENIVYIDPRNKEHPYVIKRVIGMPTETVVIQNNIVSVIDKNNSTTTFPYNTILGGRDNGKDFQMYLGPLDYFLMGDNRPGSKDSRHTGSIQPSEMFGRPIFRILPLIRFGFVF